MIARKRRHPWRGLFAGLILGLGLAIMAILYGWYWLGPLTPWLLLIAAVVLGVLISFAPRPWGRRSEAPPMRTT